MAIQKYQDSFGDMTPQSFSTMLDRFFQDSVSGRGRVNAFSPQVDAYETERGYQIDVSLPGMKRDEIKVDFQQGRLTISGERQFKNERNERRYHIVESSYGSFQRSFQLPDTVEPRQIEANFEDGVLHVIVPKNEEKTMRHQIQIQGTQAGGQPTGQLSDRMGQQATDAQVQQNQDKGNGQKVSGNEGSSRQKESSSR